MQVNKVSSPASFGKLFVNVDPVKLRSKGFVLQLEQIKDVFVKNKFNKKRYVDVILDHNDIKGFYGIISSKTQGVPMHPEYSHKISLDKEVVSSFKNWLNDWNRAYSPKVLEEIEHAEKMFKK